LAIAFRESGAQHRMMRRESFERALQSLGFERGARPHAERHVEIAVSFGP
jgi:hypothetical protein